jgi:hypothetical protein
MSWETPKSPKFNPAGKRTGNLYDLRTYQATDYSLGRFF